MHCCSTRLDSQYSLHRFQSLVSAPDVLSVNLARYVTVGPENHLTSGRRGRLGWHLFGQCFVVDRDAGVTAASSFRSLSALVVFGSFLNTLTNVCLFESMTFSNMLEAGTRFGSDIM